MNDDSEEPEKPKKLQDILDEANTSLSSGTVDLSQVFNVSSEALDRLKLIQENIPNFFGPLRDVALTLTPKLEDLVATTKDITFPQLDPDTLSKITVPSPFLDSLESNSILIEQQNNVMNLLNEILDEVRRLNESQRRGIKKMTKTINELVEDGRINGPVFDYMKKLCMEWFGEDELPDEWKE